MVDWKAGEIRMTDIRFHPARVTTMFVNPLHPRFLRAGLMAGASWGPFEGGAKTAHLLAAALITRARVRVGRALVRRNKGRRGKKTDARG